MYLSDRTVIQYRCIMSTGSTYSYVQIGFFSYDTKAGSDLPPAPSSLFRFGGEQEDARLGLNRGMYLYLPIYSDMNYRYPLCIAMNLRYPLYIDINLYLQR